MVQKDLNITIQLHSRIFIEIEERPGNRSLFTKNMRFGISHIIYIEYLEDKNMGLLNSIIAFLLFWGIGLQIGNWLCRKVFGGNTSIAQILNILSAGCWFMVIVLIVLHYALRWI